MVAAAVRADWLEAVANKMQLLLASQSKPRALKVERRTRHWLETQNVAVEIARGFDVPYMNGYVIQFQNLHETFLENLPSDCNDELSLRLFSRPPSREIGCSTWV